MLNRRGFVVVVATVILMLPAAQTVRHWGRKQLATNPEGAVMHSVGEVIVTVLG
jgi:malonyl CoA-acyl carrier protein transacylase